jgi:cystathionine beta-lyase/cystathionine gamma-synthase
MSDCQPAVTTAILKQSLLDIQEDLNECLYLSVDCINRLKTFLKDIQKVKIHIGMRVYQDILITTEQYIDTYSGYIHQVKEQISIIDTLSPSLTILSGCGKILTETHEFLRVFQTRVAALVTSTDWQSPTFSHSLHSEAGRQLNTIYATINDYKRDQHWDSHRYERAFLSQYIDGILKIPVSIWSTSSGMAAFTTILNFLLLEHKVKRTVLIGKSIYFENKALLLSAFGEKIIEVDESDTQSIIQAVKTHNPSVIIFDSLTNAPGIPVVNLTAIFRYCIANSREETYIIIDNTCLSTAFQPLPLFLGRLTKLKLIMFESLNKYHQFGMDRVTGGILWSLGAGTEKLFDYRVHLGTILPDVCACSMPTPNRSMLEMRLVRFDRNATILASHLTEWIESHPHSPFSSIVYPGLPNHPDYKNTMLLPFHGSYFTIQFKRKYQTISSYKRFVALVITTAKKYRVDIVSGTSFGLHTTRIYLTAIRSKPTMPFVRIALGTEHRLALEKIQSVFIDACSNFR